MEMFTGLILVIAAVAALIFFKGTIRKAAKYTEDAVTTSVNEANTELTERSMAAYQDLIDRCGTDFKTPQEVYNLMNKRAKRIKPNPQNP